jgi:hypothetical protein
MSFFCEFKPLIAALAILKYTKFLLPWYFSRLEGILPALIAGLQLFVDNRPRKL